MEGIVRSPSLPKDANNLHTDRPYIVRLSGLPGFPGTPFRLVVIVVVEYRRKALLGAIYPPSVKIGGHSERLGDKILAANDL